MHDRIHHPDTAAGPLAAAAGRGAARSGRARLSLADALTYLAACLATGVAAQGMWQFFGDVLHFPPVLRALMFAFIELAVITSAVRARRALREHGRAGIDAAAVWALTGLSAVLSAMDARSFPEAVFRLAAPLVAAWLWERGMATERHTQAAAQATKSGGRERARVHWRITPTRVLVRLGLADPAHPHIGDVAAGRRLTALALAAKRARRLRDAGAPAWRQRRALARLDTAMERAVTTTPIATDPETQTALLAQLAALNSARALLDTPTGPWPVAAGRAAIAASPPLAPARSAAEDRGPDPIPEAMPDPVTLIDGPATDPDPIRGSAVAVAATDRPASARATDRIPAPAATTPSPGGSTPGDPPIRPRPRARDLDRVRAAIANGDLPPQPTAAAIRSLLAISPAYARAARDHLRTHPTPDTTDDNRTPTPRASRQQTPETEKNDQHNEQEPHQQPPPEDRSAAPEGQHANTDREPIQERQPGTTENHTPMHHRSSRPVQDQLR